MTGSPAPAASDGAPETADTLGRTIPLDLGPAGRINDAGAGSGARPGRLVNGDDVCCGAAGVSGFGSDDLAAAGMG